MDPPSASMSGPQNRLNLDSLAAGPYRPTIHKLFSPVPDEAHWAPAKTLRPAPIHAHSNHWGTFETRRVTRHPHQSTHHETLQGSDTPQESGIWSTALQDIWPARPDRFSAQRCAHPAHG